MKTNHVVTFVAEDQLYRELRRAAAEDERSVAALVRRILRERLAPQSCGEPAPTAAPRMRAG